MSRIFPRLNHRCTIERETDVASDPHGSDTTWAEVASAVPCFWQPQGGSQADALDRTVVMSNESLRFMPTVDVQARDRIVSVTDRYGVALVSSNDYREVEHVARYPSYKLATLKATS